MPGTPSPRRWRFLGVLIDVLTEPDAPVTVVEGVLPDGASPPAHVHDALDDSFYLLEGHMVIHCGDDIWHAGPGSWVQFRARVPHTFGVLGGPARILMVHADQSFLAVVQQIGPRGHHRRCPEHHPGPHHRGTRPGVRRPRHHQRRPARGTGRSPAPPRPPHRRGRHRLTVNDVRAITRAPGHDGARREIMGEAAPTSTAIEVSALALPGLHIEITAIALRSTT